MNESNPHIVLHLLSPAKHHRTRLAYSIVLGMELVVLHLEARELFILGLGIESHLLSEVANLVQNLSVKLLNGNFGRLIHIADLHG